MRLSKRLLTLVLAVLLCLAFVSAAEAKTDTPTPTPTPTATATPTPAPTAPPPTILPTEGDYVIRIDGGVVSEHLETVDGRDCLRVDLFLDGVTTARLLSSISFKLLYDPAQLTFEKYTSLAGSMSFVNPNVPGLIQFAYASVNGTQVSGTTPLLTLWFTLANGLPEGTQISFAFSEPIKADSVPKGSYHSEKRSVGAQLRPFVLSEATVLYGDANCDGAVTAADAAHVLRSLIGLDTISEQGLKNAGVSGAETLSAEDAALILRYIVKLIGKFPVEE